MWSLFKYSITLFPDDGTRDDMVLDHLINALVTLITGLATEPIRRFICGNDDSDETDDEELEGGMEVIEW